MGIFFCVPGPSHKHIFSGDVSRVCGYFVKTSVRNKYVRRRSAWVSRVAENTQMNSNGNNAQQEGTLPEKQPPP
jgi:hypothetical protein